jgi:hypothetical protein
MQFRDKFQRDRDQDKFTAGFSSANPCLRHKTRTSQQRDNAYSTFSPRMTSGLAWLRIATAMIAL